MGLIKEPLNVDFYVEGKSLTTKEREAISLHITQYRAKMAKRKNRNARTNNKTMESSNKYNKQ